MFKGYNPIANEKSIIKGKNYRITILTSKLIRLEYSENGIFEDSMTKMVLNRKFDEVKYDIIENENSLKIITEDVTIRYNKKEFSNYGLSVCLNMQKYHPYKCIWRYSEKCETLGGTIRCLDFINGSVEISDGILSKNGIAVLDDSNSPIIKNDGYHDKRNSNNIDLYVFAYQRNYLEALSDFYKLTGYQPKIPRYALGNWWSRYYRYDENSYIELLEKFKIEKIPFSVAVIDMDWHLSKWTSYTWNNDLFPNPERFLNKVKSYNYHTALNLHPASGIDSNEIGYNAFCNNLNIGNKYDIDFDFNNKEFIKSYFEILLHPNENIGVDFWWIDWQQSPKNIDENIDYLWPLNHYHYLDSTKNNKLGLILSRYSGVGSHRYPVGFSGDTDISWESLDFQPYFTLTSSNIGYGWWSHDIGGHRYGIKDNELFVRWVQFGVFSPINRLHSSNSEFLEKEPWNYKEPYQTIIRNYLKLRHELIPYIYTMTNISSIPLIRPMYYYYPDNENSYKVKNQYYFADNIIVCPITKKTNINTNTASFNAWLPDSNWYDYFTGLKYKGDRNIIINRDIYNSAIFIKQGSIVPLAILDDNRINDINNPNELKIVIGTGSDAVFILKEDFNEFENQYETCNTKIEYFEKERKISIKHDGGDLRSIPSKRRWEFHLYGKKLKNCEYNENMNVSIIRSEYIESDKDIIIYLDEDDCVDYKKIKDYLILNFLKQAEIKNNDKKLLYDICTRIKDINIIIGDVLSFDCMQEIKDNLIEILIA